MRKAALIAALALTLGWTAPGRAQDFGLWFSLPGLGAERPDGVARGEVRPGLLPPHSIVRRLRGRGFHGFREVDFRGDHYMVRAYGPAGNFVRLAVDPYSGEVLERRVLQLR